MLSEQDVGPYQVQILRPGNIVTADTRKKVENSPEVRRGEVSPRNLLQIQPVCIDLTAGTAFPMFRSGDAEPVVLSVVELPDHSLMRFRRVLDKELAGIMARLEGLGLKVILN